MPDIIENGPVSYSMTPYTGAWTKVEAAHLLRRTMFGPTNQQILDAVADGMDTTVANLLQLPALSPPLAWSPDETVAPLGTTWVDSVYPIDGAQAQSVDTARLISLASWVMERINTEGISIAEKMCLFWQNHFAATFGFDQRGTYDYFNLIYQHALGDFKQFAKDMTVDVTMLQFLNGATNTVYSPNENYARELLELFTIGKGEQIGGGDYSNYTEEDVAAGAKILTGYVLENLRSDTEPSPNSIFIPAYHDTSTKTLSYHFGGQTVPNNGANEYADYIDVIFAQDQVATFICTKIYRYFVNYDITVDVETNVIPVLAQTLIDNNYTVLPVIEQLLKSEHFYDAGLRGSIIRSPLDMVFGMLNATTSYPSFDAESNGTIYATIYAYAANLGQPYIEPPSVAGWPAYYQSPAFTKLWVNATHIKNRFGVGYIFTLFEGLEANGNYFKIDALAFLDGLSVPSWAPDVVEDICDVFFPKEITQAKKDVLHYLLTGGLGDTAFETAYNQYASDPGNETYASPVRNRVELTLFQVFQMPEFQTI